MKSKPSWISVFVVALWLLPSAVEAQKPVPKFPDVWGIQLPLPKDADPNWNSPIGRFYWDRSNRPIFEFDVKQTDRSHTVFYYDFFTGEVVFKYIEPPPRPGVDRFPGFADFQRRNGLRLMKRLPLKIIAEITDHRAPEYGLPLSDGTWVVTHVKRPVTFGSSIQKLDSTGRIIMDKFFVRSTREKRLFQGRIESDYADYKRDRYYRSDTFLSGPALGFYPLGDGTYLAGSFNLPLVLRVDQNLNAPFLKGHPELIILDADDINAVDAAADRAWYSKPRNDRTDEFVEFRDNFITEFVRGKIEERNAQ